MAADAFNRCRVHRCLWRVWRPATRCYKHGGPKVPQYAATEDGDILDARFMPAIPDYYEVR